MKKSRTVPRPTVVETPRHLPLVDLLVDARAELFELLTCRAILGPRQT